MKKLMTLAVSALALLVTIAAHSQEGNKERKRFDHVKEKTISKTYPASGNNLSISNSFGNVEIIAWDKNEIKVDIHIEASSTSEENATTIFNNISVSDSKSGNEIRFKTKIDNDDNKNCRNCKSSMNIDYQVHLPVSVALDIENSFGNTTLPDYSGTISVSNKFGKLNTGSLANVKDITVEFGEADIKSIANIDATFKFSKISIGNLSGKNKIHIEFCDKTNIRLDNNINSLALNESYSTVSVMPPLNLSANYSIATSYGTVIDRSSVGIKRTDTPDEYGPDANKTYEGKSGSGSVKIDIKSSFGKIIIGEPGADDMRDKEKKKKVKS